MEQLKKIAARINAFSVRERAIVFIGLLVVIYSVWDAMLMAPLSIQQKKLVVDFNSKNTERLVLSTRLQQLIKESQQDPDAANLAKLKALRSKLIDTQAGLEVSTRNLVSPNEMPKLLESVLHKTDGLTLVSLKNMGVKPLIAKEAQETVSGSTTNNDKKLTADNLDNAYKHGLRIEFIGDYFTTINYLKSLEQLEWGFFWDNLEFQITEYPDATASIEIFTLSLNKEWIGV